MGIKTNNTMPKDFAVTAIINLEEPKNHGIAHMTNSTQPAFAKTATLTTTIAKRDSPKTSTQPLMTSNTNSKPK